MADNTHGHIVLQAVLEHGAPQLPPHDRLNLILNARLTCRAWARLFAPHVRAIRVPARAWQQPAPTPPSLFPCAQLVTFEHDPRVPLDADAARLAARSVGFVLWRTLVTVRVDCGGAAAGGEEEEEEEEEEDDDSSEDEDESATPSQHQQHQHPPPNPATLHGSRRRRRHPPPLLLWVACGGGGAAAGTTASMSLDGDEAAAQSPGPASTTVTRCTAGDTRHHQHHHHPRHLDRWLVSQVAKGARRGAAAAAAPASLRAPPLSGLELANLGELPAPWGLLRTLRALPQPPRHVSISCPSGQSRHLSGAHLAAIAEAAMTTTTTTNSSALRRLSLAFRMADGVPARPLVLDEGEQAEVALRSLSHLALTYTGPPELGGCVQVFKDSDAAEGKDDDGDDDPRPTTTTTTLTNLHLDMVALPLTPRIFTPSLATNLTVLRLRQREPFTAAEAALIGTTLGALDKRRRRLHSLSLAPLPWTLARLALGQLTSGLRSLDLVVVDRDEGEIGSALDDDDDDDDDDINFFFDDTDAEGNDNSNSTLPAAARPRLQRAPGSVIGLGLAGRAGSLALPTTTPPTATTPRATAALLAALRRCGAHVNSLALDLARTLSLLPSDVEELGQCCPALQSLELAARLEQGTVGFAAAFPQLKSLSLRGARCAAADAWSPGEWGPEGRGGDGSNDKDWSWWSRAPRHRRALTDPIVLVPEHLPRSLAALECRDVWACVEEGEEAAGARGALSGATPTLALPKLERLSLHYVGACPGCASPLPMMMTTIASPFGGGDGRAASSFLAASSASGNTNQLKRATSRRRSLIAQQQQQQRRKPPSLRDWLTRPLQTLAAAALDPQEAAAGAADQEGGSDDDDGAAARDQQQQRQQRAPPLPPSPLQPTVIFVAPNAVVPTLAQSRRLCALELALPCNGPCCACSGSSSGGGRACSSFAASSTSALQRRRTSSGSLPAAVAVADLTASLPRLELTLHLPRQPRRLFSSSSGGGGSATSGGGGGGGGGAMAHYSRALASALPRAMELVGPDEPPVPASLRLLCRGDVRCGTSSSTGSRGQGCTSAHADALRQAASMQLAAMARPSLLPSSSPPTLPPILPPPAIQVAFVHDPLPHLAGFQGLQCECAFAAAAGRGGGSG